MLAYKTRQIGRRLIQRLGYNLVKIPREYTARKYPYVRSYSINDRWFSFWIADEQAAFWYDNDRVTDNLENFALAELVAPGDRILEIGSHHGFFTVQLAQAVGASGFVVALEADPKNALIAQSQMMLNGLGGRVAVLNKAGADKTGILEIATTDGSNYHAARDDRSTVKVASVTAEALAGEYGPFDLVKIDVEGFEAKVLAGCREIFAGRRPKLALEIHLALLADYDTMAQDILDTIGADEYEGTMLSVSEPTRLRAFDPNELGDGPTVNLFLRPKGD